jgi:hypothetical protein
MRAGEAGVVNERVEELTALVLEGAATAADEAELERLLAGADERRAQLLFLEIEATLRGRGPSQADAILERITRERAERVVRGVMKRVERKRGRRLWPIGLALLSASALAASFAVVRTGGRRPAPPAPIAAPAPARVSPQVFTPHPRPLAIAPAPPAAPEVLFRFDFENGALPDGFIEGHVVSDPCPGSRACALGTISPYGGRTYMVAIERTPQLFRYAAGQVIAFDFWAGADAPALELMTWAPGNKQNYAISFDAFPRERWVHAEVRLADLVGKRRKDHLAEGEQLSNILIMAGRTGGKPLYVDNFSLTAYPGDAPLTGVAP